MKIIVLGCGLQGRAALYDLAFSENVSSIIAADMDVGELQVYAGQFGERIQAVQVDARDPAAVAALLEPGMAMIHLLPPEFRPEMARVAVENGCHFIDASYPHPSYAELHEEALARGVAILPEFGLDPGIDLLLARAAVEELDQVVTLNSYGAGVPAPEAARNALRYKISWTWEGVLRSYTRPARLIQEGQPVEIDGREIFSPAYVHHVEVEGLGRMEAYPNGDPLPYLEALGLEVQEAGRYSLRWPGHCAFWYPLVQLGFLDDEQRPVGDQQVNPLHFVRDLLEPQLQYGPDESDVAIVRVEAAGWQEEQPRRVVYQVIDQKNPAEGLLAMQRTVGFTASIGAQMILQGDIEARGLLSPVKDVPSAAFFNELSLRDIYVRRIGK